MKDSSELEIRAARIASGSRLRSFPVDYAGEISSARVEIPSGTDIIMFRQDENTVVSIDSHRIYLHSHEEAKYVYYSAKRGQKQIPHPGSVDLHSVISEFESDLDETLGVIENESRDLNDTDKAELKSLCSRFLGYHDIF